MLATAVVYCSAVKVLGDAKVKLLTRASAAIVAALAAVTPVTVRLPVVFLLATAVVYCSAVKVVAAKVRLLTLASAATVAALATATLVTLTLTLLLAELRIFANLVAS